MQQGAVTKKLREPSNQESWATEGLVRRAAVCLTREPGGSAFSFDYSC